MTDGLKGAVVLVFGLAVSGLAGGEGVADAAKAAGAVPAPVTIQAAPAEAAPVAPAEKPAESVNILAIKNGQAICCACKAGCKCTLDEVGGMCSCGQELSKKDLTGKFVCEKCKVVAEKAGKCACGADLVEVKAQPAKDAPKVDAAPKAE